MTPPPPLSTLFPYTTLFRSLSPQETDRRAKHFEEKLRLLPDSLAVHEEWRKLLVTYGVSGVQVHDARLAAAMRVHGVKRILTFNERDCPLSRHRGHPSSGRSDKVD